MPLHTKTKTNHVNLRELLESLQTLKWKFKKPLGHFKTFSISKRFFKIIINQSNTSQKIEHFLDEGLPLPPAIQGVYISALVKSMLT